MAAVIVLWRGSLDPGGAVAGVIVGTLIFVCGGPLFWIILMAFFVSSTALGYVGRNEKEPYLKALRLVKPSFLLLDIVLSF